jgi:cytochrome P450
LRAHSLPPGPRGVPFLGNSISYRKDRLGYLTKLHREYGPTVTMHLGRTPAVLVTAPTALREVLVDHSRQFVNRDVVQNMALLLGDSVWRRHPLTPRAMIARCCGCAQEQSLLSTDGEVHDQQRHAMLGAFHGPALERYREIMIELTGRMLDSWGSGTEIEVCGEMQRLTASVVFQTLFGVDLRDRSSAIVSAYKEVLRHSPNPLRSFIPVSDAHKEVAWKDLMEVVDQIVQQAAARTADSRSTLLVDLILRSAPAARASGAVRDQVTFFMGAGHITVSGLLVWAICLLARHPDVLSNLTGELRSVLRGSPPAMTDLPNLPCLDRVVKEALRLYPAVWLHGRRTAEDCVIDGWRLPKGVFVVFSQWVTQRSEEYFSEPLRFIPERFVPNGKYLHTPSAYFPFGIGARACLGSGFATLEAKVVLAMMLQQFVPVLVDGGQLEPTVHYAFLQPRGEVRMRMERASWQSIDATASPQCGTQSTY